MEIIPQIQDVGKKTGLIQTIAPALEHALGDLEDQMNRTSRI